MAFLQGSTNLVNGQRDYTIPFEPAFTVAPELVIPVVINTSADVEKYFIEPGIRQITESSFTIKLNSAPNSNNYELVWVAGTAAILYQLIATNARKISDLLVHQPADLIATDFLPIVSVKGAPQTKRILWSTVVGQFWKRAGVPSGPAAPGAAFDLAVDGTYVYVHNGVSWGRFPYQHTNWNVAPAITQQTGGSTALANGVQQPIIPFGVTFGSIPRVTWSIFNGAAGNKSLLSGLTIAKTTTQFQIHLNIPPPDGNYVLDWDAKL